MGNENTKSGPTSHSPFKLPREGRKSFYSIPNNWQVISSEKKLASSTDGQYTFFKFTEPAHSYCITGLKLVSFDSV